MADVFAKWKSGLAKTSKTAFGRLATFLGATEITQETWEALETLLIQADVGIETTAEILDSLHRSVQSQGLTRSEELSEALRAELRARLDPAPALHWKDKPSVIMVVGVNGSGKTTTLYAIIKILHKPEVNVTTIEDPVEYKISGANQIQVNPETDLTFAKGLRSIVRQDPNIILVGEIRDSETAEISINAALTGHLLLSSFHANDASAVIPRLFDMGIEPFLLSSTLNLIIAQRLTRRICDNCKVSFEEDTREIIKQLPDAKPYFTKDKITLYKGKGCSHCSNTGYNGRIGLFELINVTPEMQDLITKIPSSLDIARLAQKQGGRTFFDDGIAKVKSGVTTISEILRVAPLKPKVYKNGTKQTK